MSFNNANTIIRISNYRDRVDRVTAAGGTTSKAYRDAANRWDAWSALRNTSPLQALTDAYEAGTPIEDLAPLRTAALTGEASNPIIDATVHSAVAPAAYAAMVQAYQPNARANYDTARTAFNTAAAEFHTLAEKIDPEADAASMVRADDATRAAWLKIEVTAHHLDTHAAILADAATLAGKPTNTDSATIGATVNADGLHVRRVWEAWANTDGRTGKWGALVALGATIEAPELDDLSNYREPMPMEIVQEHSGIGVRQVQHDPEDDLVNA